MAEYEMQEMNLPNKEGKRVLYPRLVQRGQADTDYIAKTLAQKSAFSKGDVVGLLQELSEELAYQMGQGKSVKLDGIGTFVPSLALRADKERETGEEDSTHRNARSIVVGSINFRAEKELLRNTNYNCELERSQQKFHRSSQKYSPDPCTVLSSSAMPQNSTFFLPEKNIDKRRILFQHQLIHA